MSRKDDLTKYRKFYNGDQATIYSEFKTRYLSTDVATADKFTLRNFVYQNDVQVIQNERVTYVPVEFEISVSKVGREEPDKNLTSDALEWLNGPYFGGEKTFWEALPGYYKTHENSGDLFLKLYVEDGEVKTQKMYSETVDIICDPKDVRTVTGYIFEWKQAFDVGEDHEKEVTIKEVIDGEAFTRYQEGEEISRDEHGFDFIPVVKITREEQEGIRYGKSGIKDLIEPQMQVNMALTKRAWATKHNAFRVWAPKGEGKIEPGTTIKVSPGSVSPIPLEAVGGDINLVSLENELDDYKTHLYRIGAVPDVNKSEGLNTNISAVALNKMLEPLRKYTRAKLPYLRKGFSELIEKAFLINGKEIDVTITYPSLEVEDRATILNDARFFSELGYEEKALKILGVTEDERKEMEADREKTQQERQQRAFEFQDKMINRGEETPEEKPDDKE